jgi:Flp pilus assembly protein TadG
MSILRRVPRSASSREDGQSLLETAIAVPMLLGVAFNIINFAYFWFMVLALSAAPRHGAQFATQGGAALSSSSTPVAADIRDVVYNNLTNGVVGATTSNISVRVCTNSIGVNSSTNVTNCTSYGPAFSYSANAADPEAPLFVLNRVDVAYTVTPVIPGSAFGLFLPSSLTFHRQVSMRNLY